MAAAGEIPRNCPTCGAPTSAAGPDGAIICRFCKTLIHEPVAPSSDPFGIPFAFTTTATSFELPEDFRPVTTTTASKPARAVGCLIAIIVIGALGVAGFAVFKSVQRSSSLRRAGQVNGSLSLSGGETFALPGEPGGTVSALALAYDSVASHRRIIRIDTNVGKPRWQSDPLPSDVYSASFATDGDLGLVATKDSVQAFRLDTGTLAWRAALSDDVDTTCATCFVRSGRRLLVRTRDANVQAFDPVSGKKAWERPLTSTSGQMLVAGPRLILFDEAKPGDPAVALVVDPISGRTVRAFIPGCPSQSFAGEFDGMDAGQPGQVLPGGDVVVFVTRGAGCVQRWSPATAKSQWMVHPEKSLSIARTTIPVVGAGKLLLSSYQVLDALDLRTGAHLALPRKAETDYVPLFVTTGPTPVAVVQTHTTRGTGRYGISGYDLGTGRLLWSYRPAGEPLGPPGGNSDVISADQPRFSVRIGAKGEVRVVSFVAESRAVSVVTVGAVSGRTTLPLAGSFASRYASSTSFSMYTDQPLGDRMLITVDGVLQVLDLQTARTLSRWPQ